jgi:sterol desaturase/sphingolipid hydroxylase (fatty acid hydroxylase superfamily)
MILLEFTGLFAFILVFGYLLPAGQFYVRYYVRHNPAHDKLRIQQRQPAPGQIRREVKLSLITITIFAAMSTVLFELYKAGHTSIYMKLSDYPLWYVPISFVLCIFFHDTYFYWTHRFMHWRPVFKYFHLAHHRSIAPTPWAIYAFDPLEAITQFFGIMMLVIFLPMRPLILLGFLSYDTLVNTAGHTGYEVVPKPVSQNRFLKYFNTVTHHDAHHTNTRVNYGSFFNLWDRWMGTFEDEVTPATVKTISSQSTARERNPASGFAPSSAGLAPRTRAVRPVQLKSERR